MTTSIAEARDQCGGLQEGRLDRILTVLDSMADMQEFLKVNKQRPLFMVSPMEARDQCGGQQEGRLDRILTVLESMADMTEFLKVKNNNSL
jgi:glutaredoxin-related protein